MSFHLSTKQRLHVPRISVHSLYKSKKATWATCYEKRELEKMKKKRWRLVKKSVEQKKRGWASNIAHDLNHLDLERESLRSQPSTHIHTLALLIMFICCFLHGSMLGLYNINTLSMPFEFLYPKLHISYSCRALRQSKILVRTHTQMPLSDLREPYESKHELWFVLKKYFQKLQFYLRRSDLCL
jgi:hypothetical protein